MIQTTTLSNGIRIITEHCAFSDKTSICCSFNIGSIHEEREKNGLAHLLEHLLFEGTTTQTAFELNKAARSLGTSLDGETSYDFTRYNATVRNEKVSDLMTLLADLVQHPALNAQDFEKEKSVVLSEVAAYEDDLEDIASNLIFKAAYKSQSLGLPREGTPKTISKLTIEDASHFYQTYYTTNNLIISAAGGITHDDFVFLCNRLFTDLKTAPATQMPTIQYLGGLQQNEKESDQLDYFFLAFKGVPITNPKDYYSVNMVADILNNKLYDEIREKKGLVYDINASHTSFQHTGLFTINSATCSPVSKQVVDEICQIVTTFSETLSKEDLHIAKETIKLDLLSSQDSMMDRATSNIFDINSFGRIISNQESFQIIDSIQIADMQKMMNTLLQSRLSCSVCSHKMKHFPSYESIATFLRTQNNSLNPLILKAHQSNHK